MPSRKSPALAPAATEPGGHLDMPEERRVAARAHAAMLGASMREVARKLPLQADVDDFRRVLVAHAPPGGSIAGPGKGG